MTRAGWAGLAAGCAVLAAGAAWAFRQHALADAWRAAAIPFVPENQASSPWVSQTGAVLPFEADFDDLPALRSLAEKHLAHGHAAAAESVLRGLLRFDRTEPKWPHLLGRLLADGGRLDEAIPFLQQATKLAPHSVPTWLKLGDAFAKTNQTAPAADAFRRALELDPKNAWARLGLARLEIANERWTAARLLLEEGVRDTPDFSAAHSLLATAYERSGRNEEAVRSRDRASSLGRFAEAPDPWSESLWQQCDDPYRLRVTAATYTATGRPESALPILERARDIAPNDARTLRELGRLLLKLGRAADSRPVLDSATQQEPSEPAAYLDLLEASRQLGDEAAIDAWIARGIEHCPNSAGLHYAHSKRLLTAGKLPEAEQAIADAIRLEPESPTGYETHAIVLFQLGRSNEAVAEIEAGLARAPQAVPLWRLLYGFHHHRSDATAVAKTVERAQSAGIRPELLRE